MMLDGKTSGSAGDNGQASETVRIRRALDDAFLEVPAVGLGTWSWGAAKWGWRTWDARLTRRGVLRAWDAFVDGGGGLVDTADDYGAGLSEQLVGAGLARNATNVFVATKGGGRPRLVSAASASCERLGVDRVALYQLHSVEASLLSQDAFARRRPRLVRARGVALLAYAPLASGRLARRVVDGELRPPLPNAAKRGFGRADDASSSRSCAGSATRLRRGARWLTAHGGVVAIPGCKTADQVAATVTAARAFGPPADGDALAAAGAAAGGQAARRRGYKFTIESAVAPTDEDDLVFSRDGCDVVVDDSSIEFVRGATVDFEEEMIRSAFVVSHNPNSESACGCGSSFALKNFEENGVD
ncbi:hypothetical protein JL720_804 [Aureococcus anophagefferens]|nr:hypothetical protein JL720_804 [Aureococcus anophagefferens]